MSVAFPAAPRGAARRCFETTDPHQAHELLRSTYVESKPRFFHTQDQFRLRHSVTDAGAFSLAHAAHDGQVALRATPTKRVIVSHILMLDGPYALQNSRDEFRAAPGDIFLLIPDLPNDANYHGYRIGTLSLDLDDITPIAVDLTGIDSADLRFDRYRPLTSQLARHWRATVRHVARDLLPNDDVMAQPLTRHEITRMLVTALLVTFPNTALAAAHDGDRSISDGTEPAVVRRAVGFIDAHADAPIGIGEIAAASGIGPRALQQAFRRHRDTTPLAYLRRVRLEHAHRDLQVADPTRGDTVSAIATRWGFTHHGRFAAQYRRAYGRSPNHTLRT